MHINRVKYSQTPRIHISRLEDALVLDVILLRNVAEKMEYPYPHIRYLRRDHSSDHAGSDGIMFGITRDHSGQEQLQKTPFNYVSFGSVSSLVAPIFAASCFSSASGDGKNTGSSQAAFSQPAATTENSCPALTLLWRCTLSLL